MKEDTTKFIEFFGDSPLIKVLDFLITFQIFDYSLTEIAKNSKVSYPTLIKFWNKLEKNEIVIKTKKLNGINLYKLNIKNPKVRRLVELDNMLLLDSFNNVGQKVRVVA